MRGSLVVLALTLACTDAAPSPSPVPVPEREGERETAGHGHGHGHGHGESAPAAPSGERCAIGESATIAEALPIPHGVAIAASDHASMVIADRDPSTLLAFGARVATGARGIEIPISGADEIFALEALDGDRFVAITHGRCPREIASTRCLVAALLGADGRAIGAPVPIGLGGPLRTVRAAASGDTVHVARSPALGAPELDAIRASDDGLAARTLALGDALDLRGEPTEILGLAVTGGSWAVLWRHGAAEDASSGVVLSTQLDEHDVDALHDALVLESFQWYAGSLSMIAAFEFARPRFVRIGADGDLRGEPRELPVGQPLPAPFASRHVGAILGTGASARLEIRDGAGQRIALVPFGTASTIAADVARRPDAFALAIVERAPDGTATIVARDVTCRAPEAPATAP